MRPDTASPAIITPLVVASLDFYVKHLGARLAFDCGWFISLEFGPSLSLQFMEPQANQPACLTTGLIYDFRLADVDQTYQELVNGRLASKAPPEDHAWGDRAFALTDPTAARSTSTPTGNRRPSFARPI